MSEGLMTVVDTVTAAKGGPGRPADGIGAEQVAQLVERVCGAGGQLASDGGLLQQLTKRVLESALEGEITDHLGCGRGAPTEELFHPGATLEEFVQGKLVHGRWRNGRATRVCRQSWMTGDELAEWIRSVRGPKSGANYRRCGLCRPTLPVAYMSQAHDAYLND